MSEPNDRPERLGDMEATLAARSVAQPQIAVTVARTGTQTFDAFYTATYEDVARALSITLGDAGWGREATDEAMTRAFDRWADVATYDNPAGWVYRVGLNWARSWHRKLNRRMPWSTETVILPTTHDTSLDEALAELDVKYRAVVVCRYLLDWSTDETARALDLAPGTVKSRLSTGLSKLRAQLDEPDESELCSSASASQASPKEA
jgi:RNA polymerase sigma-70 factor (ECF subfamily)